jgi:putative phage-type endonuclease
MRRSGIGASESAVPSGYHPFMSKWDLYNNKVLGIDAEETNVMRAGGYLESAAAKWYADETGEKLYKCRTRRHPTHKWMLATVDRQCIRDGKRGKLVEIKVPGRRGNLWGYDRDAIPPYIHFQVQQQMAVYEQEECDVAVLFRNSCEFVIYQVTRNDRLIQAIIENNSRFWTECVEKQIPPLVDDSDGCAEYLRRTFGNPSGEIVAAPAEAEEHARLYAEAMATIRDAEKVKKLHGNHIRALVGDNDGIEGRWGKATWKPKRGNPRWKDIALEYRRYLEALNADPRELDQLVDDNTPKQVRVVRVTYKEPAAEPVAEPELAAAI